MTKKRLDEIKKAFPTIRGEMLNRLLPLHRALDNITPSEFLEALEMDEDLNADYQNTKALLRDMMVMESVQVYHSERGQWAAKNIKLKVESIQKIIDMLDSSSKIQPKTTVEVVYRDEQN